MTLDQHLCDTGSVAEVAVDLEGGMCIPQVGIYLSGDQVLDKLVSVVLSEKAFENNVAVMSKKMFTADVFKFVKGVESIEFKETFKKKA